MSFESGDAQDVRLLRSVEREEFALFRDPLRPGRPIVLMLTWIGSDRRASEAELQRFDEVTDERARIVWKLMKLDPRPPFAEVRRALAAERRRGPATDGLRLARVSTPLEMVAHIRSMRPDAFAYGGLPGFCHLTFWWDGVERRFPDDHRPRPFGDTLREMRDRLRRRADGGGGGRAGGMTLAVDRRRAD